MGKLFVTRHTSKRYSISAQIQTSISQLMVVKASVILTCTVVYRMLLQIYLNVVIFTKNYNILKEFAKSYRE